MSSERIRILCVDDEEIPRTLRKLILQKQGYDVRPLKAGYGELVKNGFTPAEAAK